MNSQQARTRTRNSPGASAIQRLGELSGVALLKEIEKGADTNLLEACAAMYGFTTAALLSILNIAKSTLTSRKTKALNQNELNKLVRYVKLMNLAEKVLGDQDTVIKWMDTRQPSLGGRKPNEVLGFELGRGEVENTLLAIEYGVYI